MIPTTQFHQQNKEEALKKLKDSLPIKKGEHEEYFRNCAKLEELQKEFGNEVGRKKFDEWFNKLI